MRLIVRFERHDSIKYISQLDMLRTIHRALRRADIPVAYSEGFNPQPKVSFGFALSVGLVSFGEYMDITLREDMTAEAFIEKMKSVMPEGMPITEAAVLQNASVKIGKMIDCAEYETVFATPVALKLKEKLEQTLESDTIPMERHSKKGVSEINVRPWIYSYRVEVIDDNHVKMTTIQALSEEMSVRIDDVCNAVKGIVGEEIASFTYIKNNMLLRRDGGYVSPVEFVKTLGGDN